MAYARSSTTASPYPFMDINLHASDNSYAFLSPSNPDAPTLVVDRPSGDLRLTEGKISGAKRVSSISGILGMVRLRLDKYLIIITKSQAIGKVRGSTLYKVISTDFLPLQERQLHDKDEDTYLSLLKTTLKMSPMYFSYQQDLTNSFQRQARIDPSLPLWQRADDRFFWNRYLSTDLIDFRNGKGGAGGMRLPVGPQPAADHYILPVISGTLSLTRTSVKGNPFTFLLITRKSRHRVGTRYFSRGVDEAGHASNFNETEQVAVLNDTESGYGGASAMTDVQVLSYIQTRGSVPTYWAEINNLKYTPKLQVRGVINALDASRRHFSEQIALYGDNYLLNLVNQKGREKGVKDAYEQMVRGLQSAPGADGAAGKAEGKASVGMIESKQVNSEMDRLHYVYFDFHTETKGLRWHRAQLLLDRLHEALQKQGYFHGIYPSGAKGTSSRVDARTTQRSVCRTNCMDCLDRTNVVQSLLARTALDRQLTDAGILNRGESSADDASFAATFRNVWADNADVVSRSYAGTGALKTDFTRTGARTKAGAVQDGVNSVSRYVRNNFLDGPRQDGFDLLTGAFAPALDAPTGPGASEFVDRRPVAVQAVPYVLAGALVFLLTAAATQSLPSHGIWPLRIGVVLSTLVAAWALSFMFGHGALFVAWPILRTPVWAREAYADALLRASKDPVLGALLAKEVGKGPGGSYDGGKMVGMAEEGKKRIE